MPKIQTAARPERDRAVFAVLRSIRGKTNGEVARAAGVSPATIAKWRRPVQDGGTRFPQFWTLNQVAKAFGHEFRLIDKQAFQRAEAEERATA